MLTWWWYNWNAKNKQANKQKNLHHLPGSTTTCSNYYSFPCCSQKSIFPGLPNILPFIYEQHTLPQSFVLFCLSLFIFFYMYPCFLHFIQVTVQRAHIQRYFTLHATWNGTPVNLYFFTCFFSLPSSSSLSFPLSLLFPCSLPPFFLPSFLPSCLSFSNLQVLNLDHWTIYASLDTQSFLILCNSMDCSPPGSSVHGICQERILQRVSISYPRGYSWISLFCLLHWQVYS